MKDFKPGMFISVNNQPSTMSTLRIDTTFVPCEKLSPTDKKLISKNVKLTIYI
jgi:hypothetical protein